MKWFFGLILLIGIIGAIVDPDSENASESGESVVTDVTTGSVAPDTTLAPPTTQVPVNWWPSGYSIIEENLRQGGDFNNFDVEEGFAILDEHRSKEPIWCTRNGEEGFCLSTQYVSRYGCQTGMVSIERWTYDTSILIELTSGVAKGPTAPLEPFTIEHFLPDPSGIKTTASGRVVDVDPFWIDRPETLELGC